MALNVSNFQISLIFLIFPLFMLMVFPLGALAYSFLFVLIASKYLSFVDRRCFALIIIFAYSLVVSSRGMFLDQHDDFIRYYDLYIGLLNGNLELIFNYGSGIEVGLPILYYVFGLINPISSPALVAFQGTFFILLILFIWLEKYGLKHVDNKDKALVMGITFLFFAMYDTTQLIRQMFSMSIFLFTLTSKGKSKYLYLAIATTFHTTAIVMFVFLEGLKRWPIITLFSGGIAGVFFVILFDDIFNSFSTINLISSKLEGYDPTEISVSTIIQDIKVYFLCTLFLFLRSKNKKIREWKYFVLFFTLLYFLFHYLPIAPSRVSMLLTGVLYGYILCIALIEYNSYLLMCLGVIFVFWSVKNIVSSATYWVNFEPLGFPFYYINL